MQNTFLIGLSRQVALSREMDVVANNIANVDTTGYKADGSLFEEYLSSSARTDAGARVSYVRDRGVWPTDFMFSLGLIIGGGTSQIQKNIIAERGLGLPRETRA